MMNDQIESWLAQMTLEEKVAMAAGADMWHSTGVPRLNIPPFKMTDGPNGARGSSFGGEVHAACFPVGVCLGSTWNPDLVRQVGEALGQEVQSKSAHVLLAPTVNIHRSPLNGRNFECYSEDPYLTARLAVAYIQGVQSQGVGACVKHFVCNDSEFERMSISSEVSERALREIYLPPFRAAVQEAKTWCVMSAYNKLNGTYCSENRRLLTEILKQEWGFEGAVISDWTGVYSTVGPANAGLDLEMPGPARWMGEKLLQAVRDGLVSEADLDDRVRRLLGVVLKAGVLDHPETDEQAIDRPEHRRLIRQAAVAGMVLFKNEENLLPLDAGRIKTLAVIGPNAQAARIMGGGSAHVGAHYAVSPLDGLTERCGNDIEIVYEQGCSNDKSTPLLDAAWLTPADGQGQGLTIEFFNNLDLEGQPALSRVAAGMRQVWFGPVAPEVDAKNFAARLSGTLRAPADGVYLFSLVSAGLSRLYLDDRLVVDNWTAQKRGEAFFGMGSEEVLGRAELVGGQAYQIRIEYTRREAPMIGALLVGCTQETVGDPIARAAQVAARSDVALVFVGTNGEWESEGFDRPDMELPGRQVELIEAVAAANPNTVVVLQTGSPVRLPWLDQVKVVLQAWFPGQECGHAIADVLFGDAEPGGRLSQTWPMRLEDNPAYINYPGENGRVVYGEGLFVGYRYYDKKKVAPRFPFGYGLTYTTFAYSNLRLNAAEYQPGDPIVVSVDVTNTGARVGTETVQLYVRDVACSLMRPEQELEAFDRVTLAPGETRTVTLTLGLDALSFYDDAKRQWVAQAGEFEVRAGASSSDIRAMAHFVLLNPPMPQSAGLSRASILRDLMAHPQAMAVLREHLGPMMDAPQLAMAMDMTLDQIAPFASQFLTAEKLEAVDIALRAI